MSHFEHLGAFETVFWFALGSRNTLQRGAIEHRLRVWFLNLDRRQGASA